MKKTFPIISVLISSLFCFHLTVAAKNLDVSKHSKEKIVLHEFPRICPRSDLYEVKVSSKKAFVYKTEKASFVSFESNDSVEVEISISEKFNTFRLLPQSLKIKHEIDGQNITFKMAPNEKVYLEIDLNEHLFIYCNKIADGKPDPSAPGLLYFETGQVYEVGELILNSNESVYIEGGAVVRGRIRATKTNNVKIGGLGVLDGSYYKDDKAESPRTVLIEDSRNTVINDIIIINSTVWVVTLYHCEDVKINNIKEISHGQATDGIDIVTSRRIKIENSIVRNDDDCIVIKSFKDLYKNYSEIVQNTHLKGVQDVLVSGCILQTNLGGHVFEIGHELWDSPIKNIKFYDCDVLGAHDHGGVFGIHNSDDALVTNITFENIRVDHYYNKLIDMRMIKSRYSHSPERGTAENILFKDIFVTVSQYNPGYSISLIGGYDENHKIKNVVFDNFQLNGKKVNNANELDLFIKHTENVIFK